MKYHYTVSSYAELRAWAKKFAKGDISICLFGNPGKSKTETFTRALKDDYHIYVKGRLSAFNLFCKLRDDPGAKFLFDDTRKLLKDQECVNLLMQVAEHKPSKIVQWNTSSAEEAQSFETSSSIAIIINRVDEDNADLEPIFSRCIRIHFAPSKKDQHKDIGTWFPKSKEQKAVYKWIGEHLYMIPELDCRDYTNAAQCYDMDWKSMLLQSWAHDEYVTAALKVINDKTLKPGAEQVEKFNELCGGSRDTFFRWKKKLQPLTVEKPSKTSK